MYWTFSERLMYVQFMSCVQVVLVCTGSEYYPGIFFTMMQNKQKRWCLTASIFPLKDLTLEYYPGHRT